MADTWQNIIDDALYEINAYSPGEPIRNDEEQFALRKLNKILDELAARKAYVYSNSFTSYTLTPNHQPHLIGPGLVAPDFAASVRPVRIDREGAALILNTSTPNVDLPLNVRDEDWWNNQRVKSLATTVPTDLYYQPDFPNGSIYLWPVPTTAYGLRIKLWVAIGQVTDMTVAASLPPAYNKALTTILSEELCVPFGKDVPEQLAKEAMRARSALQSNNAKSPRIMSSDYGTGGDSKRRGYNYYSNQ